MTVNTVRHYHNCADQTEILASPHPPPTTSPGRNPQATLLSLSRDLLPFSTWDGLARIRTWVICRSDRGSQRHKASWVRVPSSQLKSWKARHFREARLQRQVLLDIENEGNSVGKMNMRISLAFTAKDTSWHTISFYHDHLEKVDR